MKVIKELLIAIYALILTSCGSYKLMEPQLTINEPISNYQYVYVKPTSEVNSTRGGTYGNQYGVYGTTYSKSVNPADEIAGQLMKSGYIRIPEVTDEVKDKCIIISYSVSGRRKVDIWGSYTTEVTLQLLSAKTMELIAVVTAEGIGSTETDDIGKAIQRCMEKLISQ